MIPWTAFGTTDCDPDWRIELNEHNLFHYVERGPTQLTRGLDSSMLEQASERQFAISQLGLVSAGFEVQHTERIKLTLQYLHNHFTNHQPEPSPQRPTSPYREYLPDFSLSNFSTPLDPLPPFNSEPATITHISPPPTSPTPKIDTSSRSPLALVNLMNPEPAKSRPGKRKFSGTHSPSLMDPDSPENLFDDENEMLYCSTLDYVRASKSQLEQMTRTHREARMRRPSPLRKPLVHRRARNAYETEQAETEAHLLLSFSQYRARVGS
ncbi:uncharacterized protein A1O9_12938 [Exophiala aquamarina CBS 119918]|uniref:Uncharacterized protein n=1 Tax=Exophiala aquamarina CBS 119918 TaxID=1182545 RepID=A0A072NUF8_9EURO|nr:uncharacterized protein A1O9_12938 [Exophiala aquamarina CBS 119918]KEF51012.1 hypothetical protein A1O9_12938 [Exophiala aquamarina CBS 119918]